MENLLLLVRLFLAAIFAVAGVGKLADLAGSARALEGFGVPQRFARASGAVLPLAELTIALALIPRPTAWWAAVFAAALLATFTVVTAASVARGRSPDCHCFGQLHSAPTSWTTVGRNAVLVTLAGFVVAAGEDKSGWTVVDWLGSLRAGSLPGAIAVFVGIVLLLGLSVFLAKALHQLTVLTERVRSLEDKAVKAPAPPPLPKGLPVGAPAPAFVLADDQGGTASLGQLIGEAKPVLLLFTSPTCPPCRALLPLVDGWERNHGHRICLALLSKDGSVSDREQMKEFGARRLLFLGDHQVDLAYRVEWTPAAVLVNADGRIASRVGYGDEGVREMVNAIVSSPPETTSADATLGRRGYPLPIEVGDSSALVGNPAPDFSIEDLGGAKTDLARLHGQPTVLIFWSTLCRFCQEMIADLKGLEATPPTGMPRMVFLVSGDLDTAKAAQREFTSLILHDPKMEVAGLFGCRGTPSAVLLDKDGYINSSAAAGAPDVLALVGATQKADPHPEAVSG